MSPLTFLYVILIGIAVGVVVGALGAGGGILAVPALTYLLGQSPHAAATGSLLIVLATAAVALPERIIHHRVQVRKGLAFGALSIIGSFIGSRLSIFVPGHVLMLLFAGMLAIMSVVMIRRGLRERRQEAEEAEEPAGRVGSVGMVVLAALATGFLTGFFGVGGGFMVVPVLTLVLGFKIREATGTSLLIMILASAAGLVSRYGQPIDVNWLVVVVFMAGSMLGGLAGGPLANRRSPSTLTLTFGTLLAIVCVISASITGYQLLAG